jgi:hypothetical protein
MLSSAGLQLQRDFSNGRWEQADVAIRAAQHVACFCRCCKGECGEVRCKGHRVIQGVGAGEMYLANVRRGGTKVWRLCMTVKLSMRMTSPLHHESQLQKRDQNDSWFQIEIKKHALCHLKATLASSRARDANATASASRC